MKVLFLPVFRVTLTYTVSYGRRWSVLEHLLLQELASTSNSVTELAKDCRLPERVVVEALINLLRAGWIEVRTENNVALFSCTNLGRIRAAEPKLKAELKRRNRAASLCMDRLTGSWMISDKLDLIHERDLPIEAEKLPTEIYAIDAQTGEVRNLLELANDEVFERLEPLTRPPSRQYARVTISLGDIQGIPPDASMRLREKLLEYAIPSDNIRSGSSSQETEANALRLREDISDENFIVGGPEHLHYLKWVLASAKSHVVIHSCFIHPDTITRLLPDFELAALRKVRVDLLWGLIIDEEDPSSRQNLNLSIKALESLSPKAKSRITLSQHSSSSHLKAIVSDAGPAGSWETLIGSCNYLSSYFNLTEVSVRLNNPRIASIVLGYLVDAQIPASGGWSPLVVRLNDLWSRAKRTSDIKWRNATHTLTPLVDLDHYACIRKIRDFGPRDVLIACDIFGSSAETSVLVPMERAAQLGKRVRIFYRRPSKSLVERGQTPKSSEIEGRGLRLTVVSSLHAKFITCGEDAVAVTSFNWLSTSVGARARGAELGVLIEGNSIREALFQKIKSEDPVVYEILNDRSGEDQLRLSV